MCQKQTSASHSSTEDEIISLDADLRMDGSFQQKGHTHRIFLADQQRFQISELQFDKFPTSSTFSMLEDKIQNPSKCLFWFSLRGDVLDQRSGDGRFGGRLKIIALISRLDLFLEF